MSRYTKIALLQYELEKVRARVAELEQLHQQLAAKDEVIAEAGEMLAMRDRQLAALKAENEWRDIETAPKDCDVLVTDGSKVYLGRWVGRYFAWGYSTDPTHWKPLPKPPAMVQGE